MKVEIEGIDLLKAKTDKLAHIDLFKALTQAALIVETVAKQNCPVDTGALRNSITHNVYGTMAEIGTNFEYAPYVEFGTGLFADKGDGRKTKWSYQDADGTWHTTIGQKPQPFLGPALLTSRSTIDKILKDAIESEVK